MEENLSWPTIRMDAAPKPKPTPEPKTNEARIVDALESIASELFHIRQHLDGVTDGGGYNDSPAAIRTTGR